MLYSRQQINLHGAHSRAVLALRPSLPYNGFKHFAVVFSPTCHLKKQNLIQQKRVIFVYMGHYYYNWKKKEMM